MKMHGDESDRGGRKPERRKNVEKTVEKTEEAPKLEQLAEAGEKAEKQAKQRRERQVKGSHLLPALTEKAAAAGLTMTDKSGFIKVTGSAKKRAVYVARKGGRVDLSGFTVEAAAVKQISEAEAREKHLGGVRAQLDFGKDDAEVLAAYDAALQQLQEQAQA